MATREIRRSRTLNEDIAEAARKAGSLYFFMKADGTVEELLSIQGVSGIVLTERNDELAARYPGRIGWIDWTLHDIQWPETPARAIVGFYSSPELSLFLIRQLWARGVRKAGYFSMKSGRCVLMHLALFLPRRVMGMVLFKAFGISRFLRFASRDSTWQLGPVIFDTAAADEALWEKALARIDWGGKPLVANKQEFHPGKVMIVTGSLGAGGSERQVVYTALGLQKQGVSPTVVCVNLDGASGFFQPTLEKAAIDIALLPSGAAELHSRRLRDFDLEVRSLSAGADIFIDEIIRYANLFEKERPSVVHAWLDWPNCAAGLAAVAVGVPRILLSGRSLSPVHFAFLRSFMRPAYRALVKSKRVTLLNNSHAGARDYAEWIGMDASRIRVIPNAVDASEHREADAASIEEFRRRHGLTEETPVLGSVFRLMPEKRPLLWLDIAARVASALPQVRFVLVGGGPEREAIEARARELGLADKLILTGETTDVATPLAVMSCFLLTSRVEGLPNVLLEAQLSGVPVVTSAVGGAPETIDPHGKAGTAIAGDDPAPYAEAVLAILKDAPRRDSARKELPASVLERFSTARMIATTLEAYGMKPREKTAR